MTSVWIGDVSDLLVFHTPTLYQMCNISSEPTTTVITIPFCSLLTFWVHVPVIFTMSQPDRQFFIPKCLLSSQSAQSIGKWKLNVAQHSLRTTFWPRRKRKRLCTFCVVRLKLNPVLTVHSLNCYYAFQQTHPLKLMLLLLEQPLEACFWQHYLQSCSLFTCWEITTTTLVSATAIYVILIVNH